ncbi:ORF32 [callitrichine gammaherpesvirus 3]|uniref:ORF32 n=1 Tax=callitrichine gammaherpesvirus 3 TaxID=106331 RepID=Q993H8_9GAMA|nr:ORF32 [callitrichine gammaherpesvirus 3]AAK38240.1 ORF32 [callitrichine gammaherpesvirus 3]
MTSFSKKLALRLEDWGVGCHTPGVTGLTDLILVRHLKSQGCFLGTLFQGLCNISCTWTSRGPFQNWTHAFTWCLSHLCKVPHRGYPISSNLIRQLIGRLAPGRGSNDFWLIPWHVSPDYMKSESWNDWLGLETPFIMTEHGYLTCNAYGPAEPDLCPWMYIRIIIDYVDRVMACIQPGCGTTSEEVIQEAQELTQILSLF